MLGASPRLSSAPRTAPPLEDTLPVLLLRAPVPTAPDLSVGFTGSLWLPVHVAHEFWCVPLLSSLGSGPVRGSQGWWRVYVSKVTGSPAVPVCLGFCPPIWPSFREEVNVALGWSGWQWGK